MTDPTLAPPAAPAPEAPPAPAPPAPEPPAPEPPQSSQWDEWAGVVDGWSPEAVKGILAWATAAGSDDEAQRRAAVGQLLHDLDVVPSSVQLDELLRVAKEMDAIRSAAQPTSAEAPAQGLSREEVQRMMEEQRATVVSEMAAARDADALRGQLLSLKGELGEERWTKELEGAVEAALTRRIRDRQVTPENFHTAVKDSYDDIVAVARSLAPSLMKDAAAAPTGLGGPGAPAGNMQPVTNMETMRAALERVFTER